MQSDSDYDSPKTVKSLFANIYNEYTTRNGKNLALIFRQLYVNNSYDRLTPENWSTNIKFSEYSKIKNSITSNFVKILDLIKEYQVFRTSRQWQSAFDLHMKIIIECLELMKKVQENENLWIQKALRVLVKATKRVYFQSMKYLTSSSKLKSDLMNTLSRFKSTRGVMEEIKVELFPLIDNMQVSILFKSHNYQNIKMIINSSKVLSTNQSAKFRDNFLFLKAKYALVNERFKEAEEHFEMIKIVTPGQKRLVLKYLIPCKIFLGKMFEPLSNSSEESFPEYSTLIKSLKNASFKQFDQTVEKYQKVWIKRGIYLLMDRLRIIIWRNLIKRIHNSIGGKIMMEQIEKGVKIAGGEESVNECICIVGNLIYEGYIKGIIFQNEQIRGLVLRKKQGKSPFPKLSEIAN